MLTKKMDTSLTKRLNYCLLLGVEEKNGRESRLQPHLYRSVNAVLNDNLSVVDLTPIRVGESSRWFTDMYHRTTVEGGSDECRSSEMW